MKALIAMITIWCLPHMAQAQKFWGLKQVVQGSLDGWKPINAEATGKGGQATFSVTYARGCTERYTLAWTFSTDISKLTPGQEVFVTLMPSESPDCMTGRAANISVSWTGSTLSPIADEKLRGLKLTKGFGGFVGSTNARHGSHRGSFTVKGPRGNTPVESTFLLIRFSAKTDHGATHKRHSVSHELLYVFEDGFEPGAGGSINDCSAAKNALARAERRNDDLMKVYGPLARMHRDFKQDANIGFTILPVKGSGHSLYHAELIVKGDWDINWVKRLDAASRATTNSYLNRAHREMVELSQLITDYKKMSDIDGDKAVDRYKQVRNSRIRVADLIEAATWDYYCGELMPFFRRLEDIDEGIYQCGGPEYEKLAIRFESISLWNDFKAKKKSYSKDCSQRDWAID